MERLTEIYGIGAVLAEKLANLIDMNNIEEELLKPEIYEMLPEATKIHLKYKPQTHIKRKIVAKLVHVIESVGGIVAGSYRRGVEFINDLDILISDYSKIEHLFLKPYAEGEEIIRTLCQLHPGFYITVDIFIPKKGEFPAYLLYATGSKNFNKMMRGIAKQRGFLLNQHGLYKDTIMQKVRSEEDIFSLLGMKYYEPYERNM